MRPADRNREMLYAHAASASSMDIDIAYMLSHVLITRIRMLLYGSDVSPCSRPPRGRPWRGSHHMRVAEPDDMDMYEKACSLRVYRGASAIGKL